MIKAHNLHRRYAEIKDQYHEYIEDVMFRGKVFNGHYTSVAEHRLQLLTGRKHAVLTSSCSISLLITMYANSIGPGDEVIVTAFSCPASETFVHLCGAKAVFVDVDLDTGNMRSDLLEELITPATRAIVATGMFGEMHDHLYINELCKAHDLLYINDAAQSMFSYQDDVTSLSTGDVVCMSFAENKPLPSLATGGAILTDNTELYYKFLHLRNHGKPGRRLPYTHFGVRGVPDEDLAVQLLCHMDRFDAWQARRFEIAEMYDKEFNKLGIPFRPHSTGWNAHKYAVMFHDKFEAEDQLLALGVESEAHYPDVLAKTGHYPGAEHFVKHSLSIPINAHLTNTEVKQIVKAVETVWKNNSI
jgi:dTDP-4-amino-4,6-dideoxygalactose transaminase